MYNQEIFNDWRNWYFFIDFLIFNVVIFFMLDITSVMCALLKLFAIGLKVGIEDDYYPLTIHEMCHRTASLPYSESF
jgi:hypothetical protein